MDVTLDTKSLCDEVMETYNEAKSAYQGLYQTMKEDFEFYLGEQWDAKDLLNMKNKGAPALTLNYIKKTVDTLSGYERQNRGMLKAFPMEGGDVLISEAISRVMAWCLKNQDIKTSAAFKDALIGSMGWVHLYVDYNEDPFDGDIVVKHVSPFDIMIDPQFTELDLSDCSYIIRHKKVKKSALARLYPEHKDEIMKAKGGYTGDDVRQEILVPNDRGNSLLVVEKWYKDYEDRYFVLDEGGARLYDITSDEMPDNVIKKSVEIIKLRTVIDGHILAYDGYSPYSIFRYPFYPMCCFYDQSYPDPVKKHSGLVRPLKDPQREKNKRRSAIMQIINTQVKSGWIFEKGAVDDVNTLKNSSRFGYLIEKNRGKEMQQLQPPHLDPGLMSLEQYFDNDIRTIGANPDLLGDMMTKGEPGVAIQLRQQQGMTGFKEIFDNRAIALSALGRGIIEIISKWSMEKIKRILGEDLPFDRKKLELSQQIERLDSQMTDIAFMGDPRGDRQAHLIEQQAVVLKAQLQEIIKKEDEFWRRWRDAMGTTRFDCVVDETANSGTVRASNLLEARQLMQYGMPVDPNMIVELMDGLSFNQKEQWKQYIQQQQQAQMQTAKSQQEMEMFKLNKQMEMELVKQGVGLKKLDEKNTP